MNSAIWKLLDHCLFLPACIRCRTRSHLSACSFRNPGRKRVPKTEFIRIARCLCSRPRSTVSSTSNRPGRLGSGRSSPPSLGSGGDCPGSVPSHSSQGSGEGGGLGRGL
ncbi:MAG: hypothetical protein LBQ12_15160 [Deltaproteobacteria bacterium]|nr:hypothetical protein [Deltaproteobacteria bacterium]